MYIYRILTKIFFSIIFCHLYFHPHLYHIFIGDSKTFSELLIGSKVLQCLVVFFYLFSFFIFALDCCYRKKEPQAFGFTMERNFQCAAFLILLTPLVAFMIEKFSWNFESNILILICYRRKLI